MTEPAGMLAKADAASDPGDGVVPAGRLVGLGLDSVDVPRFRAMLGRRATLRSRLFTDLERAYADGLANPVPSLAARFAAKEAVMKSLGVGLGALDWWDVEVRRRSGGQPVLVVRGRAAALAADRSIATWHLSLTHTQSVASAVVAALA
jgi:holo-[acyl-carrier protein] synthase